MTHEEALEKQKDMIHQIKSRLYDLKLEEERLKTFLQECYGRLDTINAFVEQDKTSKKEEE